MSLNNQTTIMGHLGRDPEFRNLNETSLITFSVAVNNSYKKDGEWVDDTMWMTCKAFGKTATYLNGKNLKKGSFVAVQGRLKEERWADKAGEKRSDKVLIIDQTLTNISLVKHTEIAQAAPAPAQQDWLAGVDDQPF